MQYLAALNEYETINRVENQSEPEKRKKELEEIKKSNSCFLFEKGQINTDAMDRIVQQDPIINRFYNLNQPDVVKFMDWINATDMNRKKAIEQAKNIVDGFNYNKGNKLTRNDKIEAWVEKYTTCYDAIITACKVIFNLGTERQEDVFGLDAITKIEDSYMPGKIVNGVVEHLKLAEERKKNLNEYNVWYKTMINLAIPVELRTDEARVSQKLPFFDNQLNNMVISTDIKGLKQLKEKLEAIIANFNEKYGKLPKLTAQPNNDVSERLLKEGKESESAVLGIKVAVESIIKGLSVTCDGFKPLMSETAKKLSFKSPPFVEIKMNLEKLYNIDPGNEGLADLKKTYQKKISRKRLWWWPF